MSLTPVIYGPQALELQWVNSIIHNHGLICGCDTPILHLQKVLQKRGTQLCLTPGDGGKDGKEDDVDDGGFSPGDLERLFAEDGEENTG